MKLSMIDKLKSIFILKKEQVADTLTHRKVSATGLKCQMQIYICKCQYKNDQKVENKNVHFPRSIPQLVFP